MIRKTLSRLWVNLPSSRKYHIFYILILMMIASIAELISIGMVVPFLGVLTQPEVLFSNPNLEGYFNYFNFTDPKQLLLPVTIIFSASAILAGIIRLLLVIAQTRTGYLIGAEFGVEIYKRTLYQPYQKHMLTNTSEIIAGISHKTTALVQQGIIAILTIISSSLLLISITTILIFINYKVALTAFSLFGGIYLIIIILTRSILEAKGRLVTKMQNKVVQHIQEGLGGIRDILIDNVQSVYISSYKDSEFKLRNAQIIHTILGTGPKFIIEALGIASISLLAYLLLSDSSSSTSAVPVLGAIALGAQRLLPILQQIYASLSALRAGQPALKDALDLLEQPINEKLLYSEEILFEDRIKIDNVSFSYATEPKNILYQTELIIEKGTRIGLIGETGSGKSTVLDILMGLLIPTRGFLCVDNKIITDLNKHLWQKLISHVPQSIFLSDSSIAENIAFGVHKDDIDYKKIDEVLHLAQLTDTVNQLPKNYYTIVGERGVRLSGGQKQRIGIARALYKGAQVIIFDEATSALDSKTEEEVMKSIRNLPKELTMIIVAHRTSTLDDCDKIYKIENSKINTIK